MMTHAEVNTLIAMRQFGDIETRALAEQYFSADKGERAALREEHADTFREFAEVARSTVPAVVGRVSK